MNLKEACRYANYLSGVLHNVTMFLFTKENFLEITKVHKLHSSNSRTETSELKSIGDSIDTKELPNITLDIINEKAKLSTVIAEAKQSVYVDYKLDDRLLTIDAAIDYNKSLRNFISHLDRIIRTKPKTTTEEGSEFMFNVDKNQIKVSYPIEVTEKLIYNREDLINMNKKLKKQTDLISKKIDEAMLKECVVFEPKYDMYDDIF